MPQHTEAEDRQVSESAWDYFYMEVVSVEQRLYKVDSDADAAYSKLELLGFRVGHGIAERSTKDRPRFVDTLDIIKFICKEMWISVFKKQVDNLKTNHRGVFVLVDNNFKWLSRMASDTLTGEASKTMIAEHLALPCGIIRGTLAGLGVSAVVVAETTNLPQCTFQIKLGKK
ncbi:hypothetical protein BATDEDRAFT_85814 [Batrachochytrium dendrobatidis JAM81]|uniref:Trafficking protein particle complex subunit 6B n=2 Tax=Batrachochytrium dendrobatidis TaxID=109871 RepID=F4NUX8_BATDJ|nr:uncharacterized protein BATDEDRAFT_85814 [Batrachochytrium dendrobatidis JAM81]EGF83222.1 hypothetical protein BATDEDRAFT_85814 [Batrachochytrium dendrobatidis JAM81]KAJ8325640.1 hypothetical protein O5D80_005844 [Batrachochytrium dendrobatidis]KAK5671380.1 hypothetical protein QVD99_002097 [Batrachochytrium dendrobatidis]OAJ36492.1 hypothetical protein, variant [Batrachochytrium dendrobatidis JEL423]|eukprot:XP_006676021.1 hypothetical protein BATDEDRAFT_85814 [Batrachochytrium dendrobatidis JAM81]